MKHTVKFLGVVALAAIIGFSMTACDSGNNGGGGFGPPSIVNLRPDAIPGSDNPAFTDPGAGGRRTVAAADMEDVVELLMNSVFGGAFGLLVGGISDYVYDNMDGAHFSRQLQDITFAPPLSTAGISGLTGSVSASESPTSASFRLNNVNYAYRSYEAASPQYQPPAGTTVVARVRLSMTEREWLSGSFHYEESAAAASLAAAFQTPSMYGRAVINFGFAFRGREDADGNHEILSETGYFVVYLFDRNNVQVHRAELDFEDMFG
ncbi:MAG: hypothetical protein FWC65_02800 [Treponema sp.]|nr:hypothetical protein [Treponema sp.]